MRSNLAIRALTLLMCMSGNATAQRESALVVIAADSATRGPIGYADVAIEKLGREALASESGVARLTNIPAGRYEVRVRRVGYAPAWRTVDVDGIDTIRVSLHRLVVQLSALRSSDAECPGRPSGDTVTLSVIDQMRLNADRARLLAELFPHVSRVERTWFDDGRRRRNRDTILVSGLPDWDYAPGKLIIRANDPADPNPERMVVPQLVHLASNAWSDFHCFRLAGRQALNGIDRLRLDFEPVKSLKTPDVSGSIYLDTATFQLVETRMTLDRPTTGGGLFVQVVAKYTEAFPGIVVAKQLCARTTPRGSSGKRVTLENQRLLGVVFDSSPPGIHPINTTPTVCDPR